MKECLEGYCPRVTTTGLAQPYPPIVAPAPEMPSYLAFGIVPRDNSVFGPRDFVVICAMQEWGRPLVYGAGSSDSKSSHWGSIKSVG